MVEVTVHSFSNPTGRCDGCQSGSTPGCCDESSIRPSFELCPSTSACDPFVQYCFTRFVGGPCGPLSTSMFYMMDSNTLNNLEDSSSIFDGNNVLRIARDEPWSVSVRTLLYRAVLPQAFMDLYPHCIY